MHDLVPCTDCGGLLPPSTDACPHCPAGDAPPRASSPSLAHRVARTLFTVAASSTFGITLMACYGAPFVPCDGTEDKDGDGAPVGFTTDENGEKAFFCDQPVGADCDDTDDGVFPGADDPEGDGVDQSCDGVDGVPAEETDAGEPSDAGAEPADAGAEEADAGA